MLGYEGRCNALWVWIPGEGLLTAVVFFQQGKCENSFAWEEMDNLGIGAGHLSVRKPDAQPCGIQEAPGPLGSFNLEKGELLGPSYLTAKQSGKCSFPVCPKEEIWWTASSPCHGHLLRVCLCLLGARNTAQ